LTLELGETIRRRRMVRAFTDQPVDPAVVDGLIDLARRAPSAGNSQGWAFVVLEGSDTARYWDVSLPPSRRGSFRWPGLVAAPASRRGRCPTGGSTGAPPWRTSCSAPSTPASGRASSAFSDRSERCSTPSTCPLAGGPSARWRSVIRLRTGPDGRPAGPAGR